MGIWLRRILGLGFLSLGIALLFFPFHDTRSRMVEKEIVHLEKLDLVDPGAIRSQFPGLEITDISDPIAMYAGDYPNLWDAVINLRYHEYPSEPVDMEEWIRFQDSMPEVTSNPRLILFREGLMTCCTRAGPQTGEDAPELAIFTYLGQYNPDIKELSESDLADYPTVTRLVKRLEAGDELDFISDWIPRDEWDRMVNRNLEPMFDYQTFKFNGNYYGPEFGSDVTRFEGKIAYLSIYLKVIGTISILMGALFIRTLYVQKRGIMINPQGITILYDFIVLIFAVPAAYMVANTLLSKGLFVPYYFDDDYGIFMGNFFFCFGIPFVTLYTSRFTSQSIEIDAEGIHVDGMIGKNSIPWDSLASIDFADEYVLVGRVGVMMPRQLQKCLAIEDKGGKRLKINEPQLKSVKQQITMDFQRHSPDDLRSRIGALLSEW